VQIYCDESGGVGRGVMTLAAVEIDPDPAAQVLADFRMETGLASELKGSRINMAERAFIFDLLTKNGTIATIGIAISALKPAPTEDRGDHDRETYARLLDDVIGSMLPEGASCAGVTIDDGRYDALSLGPIRDHIAALVGPCGLATLELSHRSPGLQIADVIANTFFNRALVNDRQARLAQLVAPLLESGQIKMRILAANT
jgi:Protein of unknown function (DUF3800)